MIDKRTSAKKKAKELTKHFRRERLDYAYLKSVFQHLRAELEIVIPKICRTQAMLFPINLVKKQGIDDLL